MYFISYEYINGPLVYSSLVLFYAYLAPKDSCTSISMKEQLQTLSNLKQLQAWGLCTC